MSRLQLALRLLPLIALLPAEAAVAQNPSEPSARAALGNAYAVVVGSNRGGQEQSTLRYAEADATRVRDALVEVGGYDAEHVTLLHSPDAASLERSLSNLRRRLEAHRRRGEATQLIFYYSGHARSRALNLGRQELRLDRLRELLEGMDADLTFVMLDACQSGAYSRVRGAEPAADFSYNSVEQLRVGGMVVLASSSSDELSQESDALRGGFFTHHLVVGLRGAADTDGDGRVTVDEVYRYAYTNTLADTSRTAVGGQHVTLETELVGHGAVPLSYPSSADAHLVIGSAIGGRILVQHARSGAVVAEVDKARGDSLRLALPRGRYVALVRGQGDLLECSLTLQMGVDSRMVLDECRALDPAEDARSRGYEHAENPARWGIEATAGMLFWFEDDYIARLEAFGFEPDFSADRAPRFGVAAELTLPHSLSLVARGASLYSAEYVRDNGADDMGASLGEDTFVERSFAFGLGARATALLAGGRIGLYGELGGGFGLARTRLELEQQTSAKGMHYGYYLNATAGFRYMPARRFGFVVEVGYTFAPIIENLIGDVHDSGGITVVGGIRGEVRRRR